MKKTLSLILSVVCIIAMLSFAGCTGTPADDVSSAPKVEKYTAVDMNVACLKGPTGIGMAQLMNSKDEGKTANNYTFTVASAPDEISGKIVSGEINIASVPTNLAATLYQKTKGKIRMLAVNTLGVLSIIEDGETVKSVADLKGKTIYSTGEGSNPEYILKHVLSKNGIDPQKDVTIVFVANNDELNAKLISGEAKCAMVPEPAATTVLTKKATLRRALSMSDEWDKIADSSLMMGCVVALDSYVTANKAAVDKFLEEYKTSIEYTSKNLDDAAALCEKYGIVPKAAIAKAAIPSCNVTFVAGKEMKTSIEGYFKVLADANAQSIGGAMPADDFYYNAK